MKTTVEFVANVGYDFIDQKTGKPVKGTTRKAVLSTQDDNGGYIRLEVVKVAPTSKICAGDSGVTPLFDRFGRLYGIGG